MEELEITFINHSHSTSRKLSSIKFSLPYPICFFYICPVSIHPVQYQDHDTLDGKDTQYSDVCIHEKYSRNLLNRNSKRVLGMNTLYNYSQYLNQIEQPLDYLMNFQNRDAYAYDFSYTYSYFGQTDYQSNPRDYSLLNFTALSTQVLLMQDSDFNAYYANLRSNAFFALHVGQTMEGYNPQIRPWFTNHLKNPKNQINVSPPYITWGFDIFVLTQTTNLTYFDGSLEGVIASEFNYTQFQISQLDHSIQTTLLARGGTIQLTDNPELIGNYIYNQSATGYSFEDYQLIYRNYKYKKTLNLCSIKTDFLCLFNSKTGKENLILSKIVSKSGVIIMLELDPSLNYQFITNSINVFSEQIYDEFIKEIYIYIIIRVISTFITIICIVIILEPIKELLIHVRQKINPCRTLTQQRILGDKQLKFDQIYQLKLAYVKVLHRLTEGFSKSTSCKRMQQLQQFEQKQSIRTISIKQEICLNLYLISDQPNEII